MLCQICLKVTRLVLRISRLKDIALWQIPTKQMRFKKRGNCEKGKKKRGIKAITSLLVNNASVVIQNSDSFCFTTRVEGNIPLVIFPCSGEIYIELFCYCYQLLFQPRSPLLQSWVGNSKFNLLRNKGNRAHVVNKVIHTFTVCITLERSAFLRVGILFRSCEMGFGKKDKVLNGIGTLSPQTPCKRFISDVPEQSSQATKLGDTSTESSKLYLIPELFWGGVRPYRW